MSADAPPPARQIKAYYALAYDANLETWVLVPCSRADLLRQATISYSEGPQ